MTNVEFDRVLADEDNFVRLCKFSTLSEDGRPAANAFALRPGEKYLSGDWLEYYPVSELFACKSQIVAALEARTLKAGANAKFAAINVGKLRQLNNALSAKHRKPTGSYSGIYGYADQDELAEDISQLVHETCRCKS